MLKQIPKEQFLNSTIPEEIVLAILCNFGEDQPEHVVRQILQNLQQVLRKSSRIKKYQKQLLILSRLRKMEIIVKSQVEAMTIHYDIETDGLYLQGLEEGREEGREEGIEEGIEIEKREFVHKLWLLQEFSLEKIAFLVDSPIEKVIEIISELLHIEGKTEVEVATLIESYKLKFQ